MWFVGDVEEKLKHRDEKIFKSFIEIKCPDKQMQYQPTEPQFI